MIYQAGGAVAILAFLVFLFLCARTWRIWHVLAALGVFACAITFVILAAMTLKTRSRWQTEHDRLGQQLAKYQAEAEKLIHGDLEEVRETAASLASIRSIRGKLIRTLVDRGRVWRGAAPTGISGTLITLDIAADAGPAPAAAPGAAAAAPAGANPIIPKTVLYAFAEQDSPQGKIPWLYLGEFTVESVTPTTVSLRPLLPLDPVQANAIKNSAGTTWSLYEVVPRDDHRAFAIDPDYTPDLGREGDPVFGEMDADALNTLFQYTQTLYTNWLTAAVAQVSPERKAMRQQVLDQAKQQMAAAIEEYRRDGQPSLDEDLPADTWVKVRFLKDHQVAVDGNAKQGAINSTDYFDSNGMAVVAALQRPDGDDAEFEVDDLAMFQQEYADQLVADGTCEVIDRVYVRPLNDFGSAFHHYVARTRELVIDIMSVQRESQTLTDANTKLQSQVDARSNERQKLNDDLVALAKEKTALAGYLAMLRDEESKLKQRLSDLYRANRDLAAKMREENDRRTAQVRSRRASAVTRN